MQKKTIPQLKSWTKILKTVLWHSFFVISRFPHEIVHLFRNFLEVSHPPTLHNVETRKKNLDTRVQRMFVR